RKPMQSAKDGFANAVSTIVDANVTTLITGLILYKVGSGPVRGFATTLCIGIVTSMISALMLTRVLVHFSLEKGVERWNMMRLVTETKIKFMSLAKKTSIASVVLVVLGIGLFASLPATTKYSIEFIGGTTMTVRTEEPQTVDAIRDLLTPSKNELIAKANTFTNSVEVKAIKSTSSDKDSDKYSGFRIEFKNADTDQPSIRQDVMDYLVTVLQKGPVEATVDGNDASGRLYFEFPHDTAELTTALGTMGLVDAKLALVDGSRATYTFEGRLVTPKSANALMADIESTFGPQESGDFSLSSPISSLDSVGAQMV
ncbi:MAG: hypothetical protein GY930_10635, partial [bacterium]|nr:hypothetical protein [bacterium]